MENKQVLTEHCCELNDTDLADEGEGLPSHPFGTMTEPDGELIDKVQAQVISTT